MIHQVLVSRCLGSKGVGVFDLAPRTLLRARRLNYRKAIDAHGQQPTMPRNAEFTKTSA